jgi:hypothetical protein
LGIISSLFSCTKADYSVLYSVFPNKKATKTGGHFLQPKMKANNPTRPSENPPEGQCNLKSQCHELAYAKTWFSSLDRLKVMTITFGSKKWYETTTASPRGNAILLAL